MDEQPAFRQRLVRQLGAGLTVALALVGVAVWTGVAVRSTNAAREALRAEASAVETAAVTPDDRLDVTRYDWSEPHHRFGHRRLDPFFLQVYAPDGRLLRASANVAALDGFPTTALAPTQADGPFDPLRRFAAGGASLYRITEPLTTPAGRAVGTIQVARYVPTVPAQLGRLAAVIVLGLGTLLAALLALVWIVGERVVRPVAALTAHAERLSAATLGERVPVPPDADRETAALATALNGALARLDATFDQMQRFTADAAHELQTPLTVLRGHVDVALRRERSPDAYRETLRVLAAEAEGMTATVRGLLTLARLDADAALPTDAVDLAALTTAEAAAFRALAAGKGLALGVHAPSPVLVRGHAGLLREMVRTLLDNAVKYTPAGHVAVAVGRQGGQAWVAVEDSGPGLPADQRARATDRFWRAPGMQHLAGSGLGLALARHIATRHEGTLALDAADTGGLRATVRLPAAA